MSALINQRAKQVLDMLNQLLEWAKLELHQLKPVPTPVDLAILLREIAGLFEMQASSKNVLITMKVPVGTEWNIDRNMMSIVVRNLISNAVKYSKNGETVSVYLDEKSGALCVKDQGSGINKETLQLIDQMQPQKSTPGTANEIGTRLGQAICHQYIRQMNLRLDIESEPGNGSLFSISK